MKKLLIVLIFLLTITSTLATNTAYETSSVSRITGNSPEDLINQLDINQLYLNKADFYGKSNTYNKNTQILNEIFNNNVNAQSHWEYDNIQTNQFERNELFIIQANGDIKNNLNSYDYKDNKLNNIKNWENSFKETYPVFIFDSDYAGLAIPNQDSYVNELTRYSSIIAPTFENSREFVRAFICNLDNKKPIGATFRDARNKYYQNTDPTQDELIGITLQSYHLYSSPFTNLHIPNNNPNLDSYCKGLIEEESQFETFAIQETLNSQIKETLTFNYEIINQSNYDLIQPISENLLYSNYELVEPIIIRNYDLPLGTIITNFTTSEDNLQLRELNLPEWQNNLTDKNCYQNQRNHSINYKITYKEDKQTLTVITKPVKIIDCQNNQFGIYKNINYNVQFESISPFYFKQTNYPNKVIPNQLFNITSYMAQVNNKTVNGTLELYQNNNLIYKQKITNFFPKQVMSIQAPKEEQLTHYELKYISNNQTLTKTEFDIDTRVLEFSLTIPQVNKNTSTITLNILNNGDNNIDLIVYGQLINQTQLMQLNNNSLTIPKGLTQINHTYNSLKQTDQFYNLEYSFEYNNKVETLTDILITNHKPDIQIPSTLEIRAGKTITLPLKIIDLENDTIQFNISSPFNNNLTWTPTQEDEGNYNITIQATDGLKTNKKIIKLTVNPYNKIPQVEQINNITVKESEIISLFIYAQDEDNDNLTYSINNSNFKQIENNWFEWETNYSSASNQTIEYTVTDNYVNITKQFNVNIQEVGDIILEPISNFTITEGETLRFEVNIFEVNNKTLDLEIEGFGFNNYNNTIFELFTVVGDSGCDNIGGETDGANYDIPSGGGNDPGPGPGGPGIMELNENICSKNYNFTFTATNGNQTIKQNFTVTIQKSLSNSENAEIYFNKDIYFTNSNISGIWNDKTIPYNISEYTWYVNQVPVYHSNNISKVSLKPLNIQNSIENDGKIILEKNQTKTLYFQIPYNSNITNLTVDLIGKNITFENKTDIIDFTQELFTKTSITDCSNLCQENNDSFYCSGDLNCNYFNTNKSIIFNNSRITCSGSGVEDRILTINSNNSIKFINSQINVNGYNGCLRCPTPYSSKAYFNLNAKDKIEIINSNILINGGNGGQKDNSKRSCTSGEDSHFKINSIVDFESSVSITNSNISSIGGKTGINDGSSGCDSGGSNFNIYLSNNVLLENINYSGYTLDASAGKEYGSNGNSGGDAGNSKISIDSSKNISIKNSIFNSQTGNGGDGADNRGGDSGFSLIEFNSNGLIETQNSEFIYFTGNGGIGDCGNSGCGAGGDSGSSQIEFNSLKSTIINYTGFNGYTGDAGQGNRYSDDYSDGGDAENSLFKIKSYENVLIDNLKYFNINGGKGGEVQHRDGVSQVAGRGGDTELNIESRYNLSIKDSTLNLKGGLVDSVSSIGSSAGSTNIELYSSRGKTILNNSIFYANGANGGDAGADSDSSSVWKGSKGGNTDFLIYGDFGIDANNFKYYGNAGNSGRGLDSNAIPGDAGDSKINIKSFKGDIKIVDSLFESNAGSVGSSEYNQANYIANAGDSDFILETNYNLFVTNSQFKAKSGDVVSFNYNGDNNVKIEAKRAFINSSNFDFSKGVGGKEEILDEDKFEFEIDEELTIDSSSIFTTNNYLVPINFEYSNPRLNKLKFYQNTFSNNFNISAPSNTLIIYDTNFDISKLGNASYRLVNSLEEYSRHIPQITFLSIKTPWEFNYEFEDVLSNFTYFDEDNDNLVHINYSWYVNGELVEQGIYEEGAFPVLSHQKINTGDLVLLRVIPYDGYYYGKTYDSNMLINPINYNNLNYFNVEMNYLNHSQNISMYDMNWKFDIIDLVKLDEKIINNWLKENCKKEYCLIPINFKSQKDIELEYFDFNLEYETINLSTYGTELSSNYFSKGDEVLLQLKDTNNTYFISQKLIVADMPAIIDINNYIVAEENSEIRFVLPEFDLDGDSINYSVSEKFNVQDNVLIWKPDYFDSGIYDITIFAQSTTNKVNKTVTFEILNVNRLPQINFIENQVYVKEGELAVINYNITDPDLFVNVSIENDLFQSLENKFIWNTTNLDAGEYNFRVKVNDGYYDEEFNVKVYVEDTLSPSQVLMNVKPVYDRVFNTTLFEIELVNNGNRNILNSNLKLNDLVIENVSIDKDNSTIILLENLLIFNEKLDVEFNTSYNFYEFNYTYNAPYVTLTNNVIDVNNEYLTVEYLIENFENYYVELFFDNYNYLIEPNSSIVLIHQIEYDSNNKNVSLEYLVNGDNRYLNYSFTSFNNLDNLSFIEDFNFLNKEIYEIILNNNYSQNLLINFSIDNQNYEVEIEANTELVYLIESSLNDLKIKINNYSFIDYSQFLDVEFVQLDRNVFELKIVNKRNINLSENLEIDFGNGLSEEILIELPALNETYIVLEQNYSQGVYNIAIDLLYNTYNLTIDVSPFTVILESFSNFGSGLYEIVFYNLASTTNQVDYYLGNYSHRAEILPDERKVFIIEENSDNLNLTFEVIE